MKIIVLSLLPSSSSTVEKLCSIETFIINAKNKLSYKIQLQDLFVNYMGIPERNMCEEGANILDI